MVVLHAFRDSERDAGRGDQKWQLQCDAIIGQPQSGSMVALGKG